MKLTIYREPDFAEADVRAGVRQALGAAFSFPARQFGQGVSDSEVLASAQAVPGVTGVAWKGFVTHDLRPPGSNLIFAGGAFWDSRAKQVVPAQLLLLNPDDLFLEVTPA